MRQAHLPQRMLSLFLLLLALPLRAQDIEALKWFNLATRENDVARKTGALKKAVELDPQFLEAHYRLGVLYKNQGDFASAEHYLALARTITPRLTEDALKLSVLNELAALYREQGKKTEAEQVAKEVQALTTDESLIIAYQQARRYDEEGKYDLARAIYENLARSYPGLFADVPARLAAIRNKTVDRRENERAQREFKTGMNAMQAQQWNKAMLAFKTVLELEPGNKVARWKLAAAQKALDDERSAGEVTQLYVEALTALRKQDLATAEKALRRIQRIDSTFQNSAELLKDIEQRKANQLTALRTSALDSARLDSLYNVAEKQIRAGSWLQAVATLERLQAKAPRFRDTIELLAIARTQSVLPANSSADSTRSAAGGSILLLGGLIVAAFLLPIAGLIVFSPAMRARLHLLRGKYQAAAQIYERLLAANPGKLKLYPLLARIYLLSGRTDDQAIHIFKTILRLNLAQGQREQITAIVTQNYLLEGKTDAEAIELLENALQEEYSKKGKQPGDE